MHFDIAQGSKKKFSVAYTITNSNLCLILLAIYFLSFEYELLESCSVGRALCHEGETRKVVT